MGKLINLLTRLVGFQNLFDMNIRHDILVFPLIKLLRSIDKVDITIDTILFENDNRGRNAGIKEDIGR